MKICVAQTKPRKGAIQYNIDKHKELIDLAVSYTSDIIIFPELSLTGYEPALAKELATDKEDTRFNDFQELSNTHQIIIGIGMPTKKDSGVCISMIIFQPHKERVLYSKKYLHADEEPFFISGENSDTIIIDKTSIALAICYELSIPEHSANASENGAGIYIASVAKTATGIEKASESLSAIAKKYAITVLLSNCTGYCDNFESGGKTAAWNSNGILTGQLNDTDEGILIVDTDTVEVIEKNVE